jgi:hypothetical protein
MTLDVGGEDGSAFTETEQLEDLLAFSLKILGCHGAGCMSFIEDAKAFQQGILVEGAFCAVAIFRLGVAPLPFESRLLLFCAFALTFIERLRA